MPLLLYTSLPFTSGTTRGTFLSILKALLLSITVHPLETAIGENFLDVSPPAENIAKSKPSSNEFSVNSLTIYSFPLKLIFFPLERYDEKKV